MAMRDSNLDAENSEITPECEITLDVHSAMALLSDCKHATKPQIRAVKRYLARDKDSWRDVIHHPKFVVWLKLNKGLIIEMDQRGELKV
jgi:hypothetical protein